MRDLALRLAGALYRSAQKRLRWKLSMKRLSISWPYGAWLIAATSSGIGSWTLFPDDGPDRLPVTAVLAVFLGFGIWLAVLNKVNKCGEGWIPDMLLGIFVAAVLYKWGFLAAMALQGS
jgi:hypothetical protein